MTWLRLCSTTELCLANTLRSGQAFSWQWLPTARAWVSPLDDFVVALKEIPASAPGVEEEAVFFRVFGGDALKNREARVRSYFRCDEEDFPRLSQLYEEWGAADENFRAKGENVRGLRILRQDPSECLFSFLCSQNNNVKRIASMLQRFREEFGARIATDPVVLTDMLADQHAPEQGEDKEPARVDEGTATNEGEGKAEQLEAASGERTALLPLFRFPTLEEIRSKASEKRLRELGFGYRSAYIVNTAVAIEEKGGDAWLRGLALVDRDTARGQLMALPGIGSKVADCILLFCLDHLDVVPVDTHVRQIYVRDYQAGKAASKAVSLTPAVYQQIGSFFRSKFGCRAGWAHSILFASDLRSFQQSDAEQGRTKRARSR